MSAIVYTTCQYCNSACIKAGKQKNGNQKLRCKTCCKYQLSCYSNKGCEKRIKELILKTYVKNLGIRDVADLLKVSVNTVIKEIKRFKDYQKDIVFKENGEYEIDELCTYVRSKKEKRWLVYAMERSTRAVISIVLGRRTTKTLNKVIQTILSLKPKKIYTDGFKVYKNLIPAVLHKVKKYKIQIIERSHLTARGKLRRLNRRTIAYSKSESMLLASAKLLFWNK